MPVDKKILEACIAQAAGDDAEMADFLRKRYEANDALATKFVAGYMTTADYTRKSQELAEQRKQFEAQYGQMNQMTGQVDSLRKALEAAEEEKNKILKELAGQRISTAKARELFKLLQEKYQLDDNDLPGMSDLIETRKTGAPVDTTPDLDARFAKFKADLSSELEKKFAGAMIPELGAMAALPMIWGEIQREHEDLTGKRLTFAEQQDILKTAREANKPLRDAWEDKFAIAGDSGLRMQKRDERLKATWQSEREKEEADRRSKAALEVVTPVQRDLGNGPGISRAFMTKFKEYPTDPDQPVARGSDGVPTLTVHPGQHVRQVGDRGPTAAQRAAQKHLDKLQSGGYGSARRSA